MKPQSKMHSVKTALKTTTSSGLDEVVKAVSTQRPTQIFRFLDLSPELRNLIYRFAIQPEVIKRHVREGKAPALLKTNRQIYSEFVDLYYSQESMNIEIYDTKTMAWIQEQDTGFFRIILARRSECHIVRPFTRSSECLKTYLESQEMQRSEHEWRSFQLGVLAWDGAGYLCSYWKDGIEVEKTLREREAEGMHKKAAIRYPTA